MPSRWEREDPACLVEEQISRPILLGNTELIAARASDLGIDVQRFRTIDPTTSGLRELYVEELFCLRQRRGVTLSRARVLINDHNIFGSMMVHMGDADALVSGVTQHFPEVIRPALQIVRMREGLQFAKPWSSSTLPILISSSMERSWLMQRFLRRC